MACWMGTAALLDRLETSKDGREAEVGEKRERRGRRRGGWRKRRGGGEGERGRGMAATAAAAGELVMAAFYTNTVWLGRESE